MQDTDLVADTATIPADPNVKNFTCTVVDGDVYYRENSVMSKLDLLLATEERVKGMVAIRDCAQGLIDCQLNDGSDAEIAEMQGKLNKLYDDYTKKYGLLSSSANKRAFSSDNSYCLLCFLEVVDHEGNLQRKADMFTKRTIKKAEVVTSVDTASEALAVSMGEKAEIEKLAVMHLESKWEFIEGNIADRELIENLFEKHRFAVVVNLAAQAGVRYSITNPDVYIESNIVGFYHILEACRKYPVEHLVYASSSSVYGSNKKIPYSTDDQVDKPVSLYAATKKSNELFAHAYSKLYNIPATGLRFFTVYGPAGRIWLILDSPTSSGRVRPFRFSTMVTVSVTSLMWMTSWRASSGSCSTHRRSRPERMACQFHHTGCII